MHDSERFEQELFGVVNDYTNHFHKDKKDAYLNQLLEQAENNHVSVVTPNVSHLLEMLVTLRQPGCILELGTAYGVSAYHMLKNLKQTVTFVTVDLSSQRQDVAKNFLQKQGLEHHRCIFECADFRDKEYLLQLAKKYAPFDFVFIDAAKGQYAHLLETIEPFVAQHGAIVFDNIFLNGWIVADAYPNHRQKTVFMRMKQFLRDIKEDERFTNNLLPLDDGVLVLTKR